MSERGVGKMKINELEEKIMKTICLTGISRLKELKELESLSGFSPIQINAAVKHLAEINLLTREVVYPGGSARHNFYAFELNDEGKEIAEALTNEEPTVPQKEVLLQKHKTLEIAYLFEDCVPLLKEKGIVLEKTGDSYTITMNGETYPILLDASTMNRKLFSREEYLEIFDKMWEKNSTFYYLSTSMTFSSFLILDHIEAWIKTRNFSDEQRD